MTPHPEPAVAVVVRTKDRPDFLRRALSSIRAQTFTDWECVIVNDGGDPSPVEQAIAARPDDERDRIRVIHAPESRGRWKSANAGVLATSAPLLTLHDDDDSWHPDFLDRAVSALAEHPDRDGVVARIEIIWEESTADGGYREKSREPFQPHLADVLLSDTLLFNRFVPIGFLYRRSLHEELGLYDGDLPVIGDWAFNLRVLTRAPLHFVADLPLAYWHQRVGVAGSAGNSVIDSGGDHSRYDALLRDSALREYTAAHGNGLVLYLTKFIDQRFVDVENGIRAEVRAAADEVRSASTVDRVRRRLSPLAPRGVRARWGARVRTVGRWLYFRARAVVGIRVAKRWGAPVGDAIPVVVCLWKRPGRLRPLLTMLQAQTDVPPIRLVLWNNNSQTTRDCANAVDELADLGALCSVELVNSPINVGGAARFLVARRARREGYRGPFVMIDDDQDFDSDFVRSLLDSWTPGTYAGVWAWLIRGDYWDREGIEPGDRASYVGTGGSVCDTDLLADDELVRALGPRHLFLEDIALSALAHRRGFALTRARADFTFDEPDVDSQWIPARERKSRYYDTLGRPGSSPRVE